MKLAAVRALAELAQAEPSEIVAPRLRRADAAFGPDYLIPRAVRSAADHEMAPAVAKAAMDSGVATRPIADLDAYREQLDRFVYRSGTTMEPVFAAAKQRPKRVVYAEGEDERVLRAAQVVVDEGLARPILVGRTDVIAARIEQARPAPEARAELPSSSTSWTIRATASSGPSTTGSRGARACRASQAMEDMRIRPTLIGAMLRPPRRRRRDALRHRRQLRRPSQIRPQRHRHARGREDARGDADADPAPTGRSSSATRTSTATRPPSRSPR